MDGDSAGHAEDDGFVCLFFHERIPALSLLG